MNEPAAAWVAIRLRDPAGLLDGTHADAIRLAHHRVLEQLSGRTFSVDDEQPTWSPGGPLAAVRAAARAQAATREALVVAMMGVADAEGPRLQVAIGVAWSEARAREVCDVAAGGQVLCDREIRTAIGDGDETLAEWGSARRPDIVDYRYDDMNTLLDAPFERMFASEIREWVEPRRQASPGASPIPFPERPDTRNDLFGVALSGGGMRSAVFSLGVLQAMARYGVLGRVDYLSTASGGGYAGASLTSLCLEPLPYGDLQRLDCSAHGFPFAFPRNRAPATGAVPGRLPVHGNETPALHHVRGHARLLGQAIGIFSAYTWEMVSRFVFQMLALWLLFLLPTVTLVALGGIVAHSWVAGAGWQWWVAAAGGAVLAALLAAWLASLLSPGRWRPLVAVARAVAFLVALAIVVVGLTWLAERTQDVDAAVAYVTAAVGAVSASVAGVAIRRLWTAELARRAAWVVAVAVGGYVTLALVVFGWTWLLWRLTDGETDSAFALALAGAVVLFLLSLRPWPSYGILNRFAAHGMYRSRIERTWVIAARPEEESEDGGEPAQWYRVWPRGDITMGDIRRVAKEHGPAAPYPLINTTLSFPGNQGDPKLLDRKGGSFVIAPLYSGSALTRWRPTEELEDLRDLSLAGAAAISGAAVTPNMGERTTTTISVVTTLANARLGQWFGNPRPSPRSRLHRVVVRPPLVLYGKEMLGRAARDDGYVYLSDGGHFDNSAIYELLRRRCRYIVAIAADIEPRDGSPLGFGNLGTAIRLARVDFGVEVGFPDMRPLTRDPETGFVGSYYGIARIHYPSPGGHADEGVLVLVKSGLVEQGLSADILSYWRKDNPGFPYDTTLDQQFTQPQFESYRQLGFLAGQAAFRAARYEPSTERQFAAIRATLAGSAPAEASASAAASTVAADADGARA